MALDAVALAALPIGTTNAQAFASNAETIDRVVNGTAATVATRTGKNVLSLDEAMRKIGLETPVAFASGLSITRATQTVVNGGLTYHANPASLPFTTTGTFSAGQWLLVSNITAQDLASTASGKGLSLLGLNDAGNLFTATNGEAALAEVAGNLRRNRGLFNWKPGRLSRISSALAKHRAGAGTAEIAFVGDSTTAGVGSNPAASNTDIRRRSFPAIVSKILTERFGLKCSNMGFFGDGWENGNFGVADPRVTRGSGWTIFQTMVPGGWAHRDNTTLSPGINFVPSATVATDRLDVWALVYPGYADFVVSTGGTFNGSAATNAAVSGVKRFTFSRAASTTAWTLQKSSGTLSAELIILGMEAWVSADNPVRIWNMGAAGSKVSDWATPNENWNAKNALKDVAYAPDLTAICLTINDWANTTTESVYKAAIATMIEAGLVTGDVLLISGVPSNIGTASVARQNEVLGWMLGMAVQYDLPAVVLADRWTSQALNPDRGLYYDGLHPSNVGYCDIAEVIARVICEA